MPLNLKTFKTRTLTAIIFAAVVLSCLFLNTWSFILLIALIMIGCIIEFPRLLYKIAPGKSLYLLSAIVYIIIPVMLFADLGLDFISSGERELSYDPLMPAAVIFAIWINDTMAYIVGSLVGKTPFSSISPKKTWEGTVGGALLCVVCIWGLSQLIPQAGRIDSVHWIVIGLICAVAGTLGDLFESKLKRLAGVKDSGTIMPGHGGFLDRFDSLLFAAPATWIYAMVFMNP